MRTAVEGHAFHVFSSFAADRNSSDSNIPASGGRRLVEPQPEKRLHHLMGLHLYGTVLSTPGRTRWERPCAVVVRKP